MIITSLNMNKWRLENLRRMLSANNEMGWSRRENEDGKSCKRREPGLHEDNINGSKTTRNAIQELQKSEQ